MRARTAIGVIVVGVVLLGAGVWLAAQTTLSYGWFAYAPLSDTTFHAAPSPWPAYGLLGGGLLLVGFGAGVLVGRRRD